MPAVAIGVAQHGHRDNVATRATTNFRRIESISEAEKKEDLAELEAALKNAKPVQFKENVALVLKYFDKLAPLMPEQDSNRPAD